MTDVHSKDIRSKNMSAIKSKNTKPEITIRNQLFAKGYRYKIHDNFLPGKPDIILPKYKTVIFINGCFWHMHNCEMFVFPKSRIAFWKEKLSNNKARDDKNIENLLELGWKVIVVWECCIKGKYKLPPEEIINRIDILIRHHTKYNQLFSIQ